MTDQTDRGVEGIRATLYDLQARVSRVETAQNELSRFHYELKTAFATMSSNVEHMSEALHKVTSGINRILWAIGLSLLSLLATFIYSGGLVVAS